MPYQEIGGRSVGSSWTRPADWLTLPTVSVGDQKVACLVHVATTGLSPVAINVQGAYTVDWGDGTTVQNFASGVTASHSYDPANLSAGTLTSDGFRQALMTVTMQASNTMTAVTFQVTPTGCSAGYVMPYRDIAMAGASVTTFVMTAGNGFTNALRQFTYVGPSSITNLNLAFYLCAQLRKIVGTQWTSLVTNTGSMFQNCYSLDTVPLLDLSAVTTMATMFQSCPRLASVPLFNTSACLSFSSMFNGCSSLASVPLFDASKVTNFGGMFQGCVSLTTIPLFVTTLGTSFNSMFNSCASLASVPAIDVGNGTDFANMFANCSSLTTLATMNTVKGTTFASMFQSCYALVTHPSLDVSNGITFTGMFSTCFSLTAISLNSPKGTNFQNFAQTCPAMRTVSVDLTLATVVTNLIGNTTSLTSVVLTGLRFAPASLASQQMATAALNALYTSLGTASGSQTLTVSSNPGSGSSTTSIATAKGWTVTGG